jgi:hypothetical protein
MGINTKNLRIGCCITPHGFGHAARIAAVIEELSSQIAAEFVLVTTVPEWFFRDSLTCKFQYRSMLTDVGLVQKNSLQEDLQATLGALDDFYPTSAERIVAATTLFSGCELILCDIAPLGILAAQQLDVPSVLLENFTWDWIYSGYLAQCPALQPHIVYLQEVYSQATYHVQSRPVCQPLAGLEKSSPISRLVRTSRPEVRRQLRVGEDKKMILITMGGVSGDVYAIKSLSEYKDVIFVLGGSERLVAEAENIRCIPQKSDFYHPDLVAAADAVVGKAGYSTLAEVYNSGVSYGYILRNTFRESAVLAEFIEREVKGSEISVTDLQSGNWVQQLDMLLTQNPVRRNRENGAVAVARFIADILISAKCVRE